MRVLWLAAPVVLAAVAIGQPTSRPCCDLWIYEAANGPDSYAIKVKRGGETFVVVSAAGGARLIEGAAATATLERWIAIGRLADSSTILLDGRESKINLEPDGLDVDLVDPPDAADNTDVNTFIYIRNASPAQTRKFIKDMPRLSDDARARMTASLGGA